MTPYATPKQLAGFFQISERFAGILLNEMLKANTEGALRIGRNIRAVPDEFEKFLKRRMEERNDLQGNEQAEAQEAGSV